MTVASPHQMTCILSLSPLTKKEFKTIYKIVCKIWSSLTDGLNEGFAVCSLAEDACYVVFKSKETNKESRMKFTEAIRKQSWQTIIENELNWIPSVSCTGLKSCRLYINAVGSQCLQTNYGSNNLSTQS